MAESDLELKIRELCLKRGWRIETVSKIPENLIEQEYNNIIEVSNTIELLAKSLKTLLEEYEKEE